MVYMAFDQLVNQIAKTRYMSGGQLTAPITIRTAVAMGLSAGPQHSDTPHVLFTHLPGLKVVVPGSPRDAKGLLKTAIRDDDPVIVPGERDAGWDQGGGPRRGGADPIRRGQHPSHRRRPHLRRPRHGVPHALAVAERLAQEDVSVEVIDPRTTVPMDWDAV